VVVSLTNAAASEAAARCGLPEEAVGTVHALGYRSMDRPALATGPRQVEEWNTAHPDWHMTADGPSTGLDLDRRRRGSHSGDACLEELDLERHKLSDEATWPTYLRQFAAKWSEFKIDNNYVDYADMIDLANPSAPLNCQVVIVDEAQDCSALEMRTLRQWAYSAGALVLVGDPRQALFTWRGADPALLTGADTDGKRETLGQSYRLPKAVWETAEHWASRLSDDAPPVYLPREEDGHSGHSDATTRLPNNAILEARDKALAGQTCMLATTCGYQLKPIIKRLREWGIPFSNPWCRARHDWNPLGPRKRIITAKDRYQALIERPKQDRLWTRDCVWRWSSWLEAVGIFKRGQKDQMKGWKEDGDPAELVDLMQVFELSTITELWGMAFEQHDAKALAQWWYTHLGAAHRKHAHYALKVAIEADERLFDHRGEPRIHIGTCHSFKGSEADNVWLWPDLSPVAHRGWHSRDHDSSDAVIRTLYVGMTRARHRLTLCKASGPSVDW